jgi:DNA-binding LacI/PurR family transcriptional regulator
MVGIEDVALKAGVSTATVSRALSGKPHVSDRARERVEAAASELGYVPSSTGYTLATGRHRNIGIVLPFVDSWFFSAVLDSAVNELAELNYDVALYNLNGGIEQRARTFDELLLRKRVDGLLTISVKLSNHELENLTKINKPIIGIGGPTPGARSIAIDEHAGGRLATEHLISLGHTRIGVIAGTVAADMYFKQPTLRREGYREALANAGLEILPSWNAEADFTVADGYLQAKQMLGDHRIAPTAIFCLSDEMAFGAIMAAKDLGLRVPEDISFIGFDNHDLAEFYGLTTVSQGVRNQGTTAAKLMIDLLADPELSKHVNIEKHYDHPVELIVRSSTARVNPAREARV